VGLGALAAEAPRITDGMFAAAAAQLADLVTPEDLAAGSVFPPVSELRRVTGRIAEAVVRRAASEGVGRSWRDDEVASVVEALRWEPEYPRLEPAARDL
jgi:malic enzyme